MNKYFPSRLHPKLHIQEAAAGILILLLIHLATGAQVKEAKQGWEHLPKQIAAYEHGDLTVRELEKIKEDAIEKQRDFDMYLTRSIFLTPKLSALAELLPKGFWLERISYREGSTGTVVRRRRTRSTAEITGAGLILEGGVYSDPPEAGLEWINAWVETLKKNNAFIRGFQEPKLDK